jgi:hypothetical protein
MVCGGIWPLFAALLQGKRRQTGNEISHGGVLFNGDPIRPCPIQPIIHARRFILETCCWSVYHASRCPTAHVLDRAPSTGSLHPACWRQCPELLLVACSISSIYSLGGCPLARPLHLFATCHPSVLSSTLKCNQACYCSSTSIQLSHFSLVC